MDKVYYQYRQKLMNENRLMEDAGIDLEGGGDSLGMGVIRKEVDLTNDEKQYLLAVERGGRTVHSAVPQYRNADRIKYKLCGPFGKDSAINSHRKWKYRNDRSVT